MPTDEWSKCLPTFSPGLSLQAFHYPSRVRRFAKGHWIDREGRQSRNVPQEKNAMRIGRRRLEKSSSRRVIREKGKGWKRLFDKGPKAITRCTAFSLLKAVSNWPQGPDSREWIAFGIHPWCDIKHLFYRGFYKCNIFPLISGERLLILRGKR